MRKLDKFKVSTHSRLKAAGKFEIKVISNDEVSTHSRLKAAGAWIVPLLDDKGFQHTAA